MAIFKCKMCGGALEVNDGKRIIECEYCGTKQTLPKLDNDKKINLYDRANHFRRNNEYDKAMGIYEQILNEDKNDSEAYWSLVLCRYGIEYVEDPATHKRIPTVNRAQFTSIFDDEDYKSAIEYADAAQKEVYEAEAKAINEIQKNILEISQNEKPFDVFICYKETDTQGRRTQDSVLATDLYHQLTNEGFKVFFSRITLEDKLGTAYEPYIFAALNSAKVMVVLGTRPENFNAVWVKNEWSRFLALIKGGADKTLIPAYRDMDPYDLPEEFSHLQALDMSKLGFMQDLIRGIKKIVNKSDEQKSKSSVVVEQAPSSNTNTLLERVFMFLEDGNWESADEYCERVLDAEPKNAQAYLGKLMAKLKVKNRSALADQPIPFGGNLNYQKAMRFGDEKLKSELEGYIRTINERNENERKKKIYSDAKNYMHKNTIVSLYKAAALFGSIPDYLESSKFAEQCRINAYAGKTMLITALREIISKGTKNKYSRALELMRKNTVPSYLEAINDLTEINNYKDSAELIEKCQKEICEIKYSKALDFIKQNDVTAFSLAIQELEGIKHYRNSADLINKCNDGIDAIYEQERDADARKKYNEAIALMKSDTIDNLIRANKLFLQLNGKYDSGKYAKQCDKRKDELISASLKANQRKKREKTLVTVLSLAIAVCVLILLIRFRSGQI